MRSDNPEIKAIGARLQALVRAVLEKAESDDAFAAHLSEILLSDTLRTSVKKKGGRTRRPVFDAIAFLSSRNSGDLQRELMDKPTSELIEIGRFHRAVPTKSIRAIDRGELIEAIVRCADRKLHQGSAFLQAEPRPDGGGNKERSSGDLPDSAH